MTIRKLCMDDFVHVLNWSKDATFCAANGWVQNRSEEELYNWWFHCVNNNAVDFIRLRIDLGERLVGYVDLAGIHNDCAEIGIAIGERTLWGQGIGGEAVRCLMKYARETLGIPVFHAETNEENVRARNMLQKLGFVEASRYGSEHYMGKDSQLIQYQYAI
ncbi:GNAT family N-acetyltransferase [Sporosarcina saromensis]|uniref:GNAT family N-acetyltransferase n=1 Tax=Sporosarcina saromensis TaxID=359365 RepID=A0ABU4GAY7_9BACL|nr:GNAT family N-acetyltransferase [Sporosarcina saromensis]MDW0114120.1 GNAT family N-acetyltransferase [Sporosarcina saromensis]